MAIGYKFIASSTVGSGGAATIDFSSIPATYTDLLLRLSLRSNRATTVENLTWSFNGSTASRTVKNLQGDGTSATSDSTWGNWYCPAATYTASTFGNADFYVPNYASANYKSLSIDSVTENNAAGSYQNLIAGLWSNTAAINQITIGTGASNFVQYSTAYLYGITKY